MQHIQNELDSKLLREPLPEVFYLCFVFCLRERYFHVGMNTMQKENVFHENDMNKIITSQTLKSIKTNIMKCNSSSLFYYISFIFAMIIKQLLYSLLRFSVADDSRKIKNEIN